MTLISTQLITYKTQTLREIFDWILMQTPPLPQGIKSNLIIM